MDYYYYCCKTKINVLLILFNYNITMLLELVLDYKPLFLLYGSRALFVIVYLKKNQNAPRPSEHPPVRGKKCQNVYVGS